MLVPIYIYNKGELSGFVVYHSLMLVGLVPHGEVDGDDEHHSEYEGVNDDARLEIDCHE